MIRQRWLRPTLAALCFTIIGPAASRAEEDVMPQAKAQSEAFVKAFNEHKAKAVGSLFTEDADFTFLQGSSSDSLQFGLASGRDQITDTVQAFFQIFPASKLSHTVRRARFVTSDVMVSDEDFEITGLPNDAGPIKGQFVVVRVKVDGAWKIAAERNISKVPPLKP
jgi:uncharacterized protein (TIGR02246 family)